MDNTLINWFDGIAATLQRRGINLLWLKFVIGVILMLIVVMTSFIDNDRVFLIINGMVYFTCIVWLRYTEWMTHKDYTDTVRKMHALNARVILNRDGALFRFIRGFICWTCMFSVINVTIAFIYGSTQTAIDVVLEYAKLLCWTALVYFDCAFFLGPGDFSKKKVETHSRDLVTNN